jgi:hypothetical protein
LAPDIAGHGTTESLARECNRGGAFGRERLVAAGQYVPYIAAANLPEPEWPDDLTMGDYLRLAFKDRFVKDTDHIVLRKLRGEI